MLSRRHFKTSSQRFWHCILFPFFTTILDKQVTGYETQYEVSLDILYISWPVVKTREAINQWKSKSLFLCINIQKENKCYVLKEFCVGLIKAMAFEEKGYGRANKIINDVTIEKVGIFRYLSYNTSYHNTADASRKVRKF